MLGLKSHYLMVVVAVALSAAACTPLSRTGEPPLSPEEMRMRAVEGKLTEMSRRINAVENKDDTKTQDELRTLRGEVERLRFDLDTQTRRSKDLGGDIERRVQKLESQPSQPAAASVDVVPPVIYAAPAASVDSSGTTAADEQVAYLRAFDSLKAGKYDSAIASFKSMLTQWPQGNFADNGWYWLGESQYVKRQYKPALDSYTSLIEKFPASPKVPDALFKSGLTQVELKQPDQAKATWRRVMKDYPNANAAGLAKQRLAQTP